jgi:hypothetical protein
MFCLYLRRKINKNSAMFCLYLRRKINKNKEHKDTNKIKPVAANFAFSVVDIVKGLSKCSLENFFTKAFEILDHHTCTAYRRVTRTVTIINMLHP